MSWNILPKVNLQYFLQKIKEKFYTKTESDARYSQTDEKVKQIAMGTDANEYRVLLTTSNTNTEETNTVRKCSALRLQPSNGTLTLAKAHTQTSNANQIFEIGNNIPNGTAGNDTGVLRLYGRDQYYGQFADSNNVLTTNRTYYLPDKSGFLALTSDLDTMVDWESNGRLGAKNLNSTPYWYESRTINGITWTINSDGTVTANGTATAQSSFVCHSRNNLTNGLILPNGDYIISGCPSGGSSSTYYCAIGRTSGGAYSSVGNEHGSGRTITLNGDDFSNTEVRVHLALVIANGQTVNNLVFKPMIRLAEDDDTTYQPYAMTNRELTEIVQSKGEWVDLGEINNNLGYIPDSFNEYLIGVQVYYSYNSMTWTRYLNISIPRIQLDTTEKNFITELANVALVNKFFIEIGVVVVTGSGIQFTNKTVIQNTTADLTLRVYPHLYGKI